MYIKRRNKEQSKSNSRKPLFRLRERLLHDAMQKLIRMFASQCEETPRQVAAPLPLGAVPNGTIFLRDCNLPHTYANILSTISDVSKSIVLLGENNCLTYKCLWNLIVMNEKI